MFNAPFSFNGRVRRLEYGISFIVFPLLFFAVDLVLYDENDFFPLPYLLGSGFFSWIFLAQGAKRCHDLGRSGWWQVLPFYFLILIFKQGEMEENQYGGDPRKEKGESINTSPEIIINESESGKENIS